MKQNSFILAAGVSLAFALTFSCSGDDGSDGKDGAQGLQGEPGANGAGCIVSSVDEGTKITCGTSTVIIPNAANGTNGTDGIDGANGIDGINGIDGESCEAEQGNDGVITITCGESTIGIAFCGSNEYSFYNPLIQECQGGFVKYLNEDLLKDTRDGKIYAYAEIGDYTWMADNLVYGIEDGIYKWEQALEACPSGWKLPTYDEVANTVDDYRTEIEGIFSDYSGNSIYWWTATENEANDTQAHRYGYTQGGGFHYSISPANKTQNSFARCVKAN